MKFHRRLRDTLLLPAFSALPRTLLRKIASFSKEAEIRAWMASQNVLPSVRVARRELLFDMVAKEIGDKPTLYLEFGVAAGDATRYWSRLLTHPDCCLHGFDSFEGLPEAWSNCPKGFFSTDGQTPQIDDSRVTFFKGLFDQTLPTYEPPARETVILNLDADLYSSTIYVLRHLKELIKTGTYLYFDEFMSIGHEERAFREFIEETGARFKSIGATPHLGQLMVRCESGA